MILSSAQAERRDMGMKGTSKAALGRIGPGDRTVRWKDAGSIKSTRVPLPDWVDVIRFIIIIDFPVNDCSTAERKGYE